MVGIVNIFLWLMMDMNIDFKCLTYERTEYAKQIRKKYEAHEISERRCNLRVWTTRSDGCTGALTTVQKDNYILEIHDD